MAEKKSSTAKKSTGNATPPSSSKGKEAKAQSQRNLLLIGGAAVVGILAFWLLWRGKPADTMAVFMPANTAVYVHLDLNELTSAEMEKITSAFREASGEEVVEGEPDALQQEVENALGIDYEEFISPWLGGQLGAGFQDISSDPLSGDASGAFIIVIESRNPAAADAFLDQLAAGAEEDGLSVTSSEYQGVRIIEMGADFDVPAAAQGKGVVFLADSAATIQGSLDLEASDSLGSSSGYINSIGDLAGGRLATVYVNLAEVMAASGAAEVSLSSGLSAAYSALLESSSIALGASIVPSGIQVEYVLNFDEAHIPPATLASLRAATEPISTIERYPEETILFLGTKTTGFSPESLRENMGEEAYRDYLESIESLNTTMGIDVGNLLTALDGEFSLGVFSQLSGLGAMTGGFGFQVVVTTTQDAALAAFFAELTPLLETEMQIAPEPRTIANMASYVVSAPFVGELLAYGSGSGLGYLTTDVGLIEVSADPAFASFTDSEAFQKVKDAAGPNGHPVFYLDLAGLISLIESSGLATAEDTKGIKPLTTVAAAIQPYQAGALRGVVIFFIDR